jgi:RNA polymerase sigma-70 factor (ECF subfamily)
LGVTDREPAPRGGATALLDLYDRALPEVYGYLVSRCRSAPVAEDLTAETFLAAVDATRRHDAPLTIAWLIGVARHKLVDHWRRLEREERGLRLAYDDPDAVDDPWDQQLDAMRAHSTLARLLADQRAALTLRYVDGLSVPEVAEQLGRTVHAAEALLVRARAAFRRAYGEGRNDG